jgi:hypothetical protein
MLTHSMKWREVKVSFTCTAPIKKLCVSPVGAWRPESIYKGDSLISILIGSTSLPKNSVRVPKTYYKKWIDLMVTPSWAIWISPLFAFLLVSIVAVFWNPVRIRHFSSIRSSIRYVDSMKLRTILLFCMVHSHCNVRWKCSIWNRRES